MIPAAPPPFAEPVFVTRPLLPPLPEVMRALEPVWASGWLTNNGAAHRSLQARLATVLGAPHLSLYGNGTLALVVGLKALGLEPGAGEVITTPFTFPATVHALQWCGLTPVFADIHPHSLCLDPAAVAARIGPRTVGILGVHVYGMPCDVVALEALAARHHLALAYDGAHAFGTTAHGRPVAQWGDATMYSFHATKLFHTAEGGALALRNPAHKQRAELLKNFGIVDEDTVALAGINAKMNEVQAALGHVVLDHLGAERSRRAAIRALYAQRLRGLPGLNLLEMPPGVEDSLQYLVLRVSAAQAGISRDELHARLKHYNIITRRYFHPLCSRYPLYSSLPSAHPAELPVAEAVATEVLSLPLHGGLSEGDVHRIADAICHEVARACAPNR